jgi:hypothetical protein
MACDNSKLQDHFSAALKVARPATSGSEGIVVDELAG